MSEPMIFQRKIVANDTQSATTMAGAEYVHLQRTPTSPVGSAEEDEFINATG